MPGVEMESLVLFIAFNIFCALVFSWFTYILDFSKHKKFKKKKLFFSTLRIIFVVYFDISIVYWSPSLSIFYFSTFLICVLYFFSIISIISKAFIFAFIFVLNIWILLLWVYQRCFLTYFIFHLFSYMIKNVCQKVIYSIRISVSRPSIVRLVRVRCFPHCCSWRGWFYRLPISAFLSNQLAHSPLPLHYTYIIGTVY